MNDIQSILQTRDETTSLFIEDATDAFYDSSTAYIPSFGLDHHPQLFKCMVKSLQKKEKTILEKP
jgi:hypothetical protein